MKVRAIQPTLYYLLSIGNHLKEATAVVIVGAGLADARSQGRMSAPVSSSEEIQSSPLTSKQLKTCLSSSL